VDFVTYRIDDYDDDNNNNDYNYNITCFNNDNDSRFVLYCVLSCHLIYSLFSNE